MLKLSGKPLLALNRIKSFFSVVKWILNQSILEKRIEMIIIAVLDIMTASVQGLILVIINFSARLFNNEKPVLIFKGILPEISTNTMFFLIVVTVFLLLSFSSFAAYAVAKRARRLARKFHRKMAGRALDVFAESTSMMISRHISAPSDVQQLVMRDTLQIGKFIESLILIQQPLFKVVVALIAAVILDPVLTGALIPLFILFLVIMYSYSLNIQSDAREFFNEGRKQMAMALSSIIADANKTTISTDLHVNPFHANGHDNRIDTFFDMYDSIQLAASQARFRTMLFNTFLISGGLLLFGLLAFSESRNWGSMVAYIGSLVILGSGFSSIGGAATTLNRLYPQVVHYIQFIKQSGNFGSNRNIFKTDSFKIVIPEVMQSNHVQTIELHQGVPVVYFYTHQITRISLHEALSPVINASDVQEIFWNNIDLAVGGMPYTGLAFKDVVNSARRKGIENLFIISGFDDDIRKLPYGENTIINSEVMALLSSNNLYLLMILPVIMGQSQISLIDSRLLNNLQKDLIDEVIATFNDRFLIIWCSTLQEYLDDNLPAIATNNGSIIFSGNVYDLRNNIDKIGLVKSEMQSDSIDDTSLEISMLE